MAPAALKHLCGGQIISAHTVPRGSSLSSIARNGHVLAYDVSPTTLNSTGGRIQLKPLGTRKASTFYGFCAVHDEHLFASFEKSPFSGTEKQCLDVTFRAVCRELYAKRASKAVPEILRSADKEKSGFEQVFIQQFANDHLVGIDAAINELEYAYRAIGDMVCGATSPKLQSLVIEFDSEIPVLFSSGWSPSFDLQGKRLQDLSDASLVAQQVWMSSLISDASSFVCISWIESSNSPGEQISKQIAALSDSDKLAAIIQIAFRFFENVFVAPIWYEKLGALEKSKIDELAHGGLSILGDDCRLNLDFGFDFQLPGAVKAFAV